MAILSSETRSLGGFGAVLDDISEAGRVPLPKARTLPPGAYTSQVLFDLEVDEIFRPAWIPIGRADSIPKAGDYQCVDILGEALVMTRDRDGALHVLSRVCTHRWMSVVEGCGNAKALQCPYHLWTYSLGGDLVGAPHMQGVDEFEPGACGLPEVRHEEWMGFVFVNLDGTAEPFASQVVGLAGTLAGFGVDDYQWFETIDWGECAWDWKIMVENYMECYHHIGSHRSTLQDAFPGEITWTEDTPPTYSVMHVPPAPGSDDPGVGAPRRMGEGLLVHHFPMTMFGPFAGGAAVIRVHPLGPGRIQLFTDHCLSRSVLEGPNAETEKVQALALFRQIHLEDIGICEGVQASAASRRASVGRLSLLEEPLWRFYRFLGERLNPT